jgi:DNA topoisomerase-1
MPAVGHLFSLHSSNSKGYPVFDVEWKKAYEVNKKYYYVKPYIENFESKAKNADSVIVATDFDNEGSLIGYNIARFIFKNKEIKRMKFSALTSHDLKESYKNLIDFDYGNAIAGETRHIVDWFYGINLSRALMSALKAAGKYRIMSIGRIQGPTLALAVSRENDIAVFKPENYYLIFIKAKNTWFEFGKKIKNKEEAESILKHIKDHAIVKNVEKHEVSLKAPPCFDLTTLQVDAYRLFKISPAKTLEIAQKLYEQSLISYPRTSSQQLPYTISYKSIIENLISHNADYSKIGRKLLEKTRLTPSQGKKTDPAHPAIYPTGIKPEKLNEFEKKIYDLITKRFLACFMDNAIKIDKNVIIDADGYEFYANGSTLKEIGWLEAVKGLYDIKEKYIPEFKEGEILKIEEKEIKKETTKPPARYNEATLIKELEKRSLGTKATRAVIVSTLFLRKYLYKQKDGIHVSSLGMAVYKTLSTYVPKILDETLTREIEEQLEEIAQDPKKKDAVIDKTKEILKDVCKAFKEKEEEIGISFINAIKEMRESVKVISNN